MKIVIQVIVNIYNYTSFNALNNNKKKIFNFEVRLEVANLHCFRIHAKLIACFVNLCTICENFPYTHTENFTHTHTCATLWQDAVKLKLKVNTTFKQQQQHHA